MAQIYYNLIAKGMKTIGDVPTRWNAAVQALIDAAAEEAA
ncbi:hypothetical protein SDC9_65948 [bioreactor metagenome]|uniref:Uncharacterized protein n=1 Tax=bioreactor metagenome TaxID=1076179 RepID=A0A644XTH9_9ZZZZ